MKPMGTITKYNQFIDEESQSILNSLMDESSSYFDFMQRLGNLVLSQDVSEQLVYIAASQAWWIRHEETMDAIQKKYGKIECVRPWGYRHVTVVTDQKRYAEDMKNAVEIAVANLTEEWMIAELLLLLAYYNWPYGDPLISMKIVDDVKQRIERNPQLSCFQPLVLNLDAWGKQLDGDRDGAISDVVQGLKMAEEADDLLYVYLNQNLRGLIIKNIDHNEALAIFEELYDLSCTFEVPFFIRETLNDSSLAYEAAGEYDLAIASLMEVINITPGGYDDPIPTILSRIYASLGEGKEALLWADRAFECGEELNVPQFYIRKAHALIVLKRIEEAEQNLAIAHSLILKTGREFMLGSFYALSGFLELGKGNATAALDYLTEAYKIFNPLPTRQWQNLTLLWLARAELESEPTEVPVTGKWLSTLENHVAKHDLPGIAMLTALLKTEFLERKGQFKDAREVLQQSLTLSDSPGVKTLRKKISSQIHEMNRLIREKELIP